MKKGAIFNSLIMFMEKESVDNLEVKNLKKEEKSLNSKESNKYKKTFKNILKEIAEWVICFVIAYILYLLLNYFVGTISCVKQVSMYPTVKEGERVILQRTVLFKHELNYGDIITFEAPLTKSDNFVVENSSEKSISKVAEYAEYTGLDSFLHDFIGINKVSYIKRVIGLPGDNIYISEDGEVYRNGQKIDEPYLRDSITSRSGSYINVDVPEGTVFVMGDNRLESKDSRVFGCIPIDKVNGYVLCRIWPINKIGKID